MKPVKTVHVVTQLATQNRSGKRIWDLNTGQITSQDFKDKSENGGASTSFIIALFTLVCILRNTQVISSEWS